MVSCALRVLSSLFFFVWGCCGPGLCWEKCNLPWTLSVLCGPPLERAANDANPAHTQPWFLQVGFVHTHVNCWFRWIFNEGSESKNERNSLAQSWPTCCFMRPGGYCRVLVLDTKALREHLWSPGGHLKRANCVAILILRGILQLVIY